MKKFVFSALAAALVCSLALSAGAAEPTLAPEALPVSGLTELPVTTAVCSEEEIPASVLFDRLAETGVAIGSDGVFSVYTASRVPESLAAFAASLAGENVGIRVRVYGTNDSSLTHWATVIPAGEPAAVEGFRFFPVDAPLVKYAFYRFDFSRLDSSEGGNAFTLSELILYAAETGEPELEYAPLASVELGETLPLIPRVAYAVTKQTPAESEASAAESEESPAAEASEAPAFGVYCLRPGLRK